MGKRAADVELELAIAELRGCCRRLGRGRVVLTVERLGGATVDYGLHVSPETTDDIERIMREIPRRVRSRPKEAG